MDMQDKSRMLDEIKDHYSAAIKANRAKLVILGKEPKMAYIDGLSEGYYQDFRGRVKASVESAESTIGHQIGRLEKSIEEVETYRNSGTMMWFLTDSVLKYALLSHFAELFMGIDPKVGMSLNLDKSFENANFQYDMAMMELGTYAEGVPDNLEISLL